jgi:hypothetical protein
LKNRMKNRVRMLFLTGKANAAGHLSTTSKRQRSRLNNTEAEPPKTFGLLKRLIDERAASDIPIASGSRPAGKWERGALAKLEYGEKQPQVDQALMEAWAWLQSAGLLVEKGSSTGGWFFVSRRAKQITSHDGFAAYSKASLMRGHGSYNPRDIVVTPLPAGEELLTGTFVDDGSRDGRPRRRDLSGILRSNWPWLLAIAALVLATMFLPERFLGSPLFFPIVTVLLILLLVSAVWKKSSPH